MFSWLRQAIIVASTLTVVGTLATPAFADSITWTQGQQVEFSMHTPFNPFGPSSSSLATTTTIEFSNNQGGYYTAKATIVPKTEKIVFGQDFADYTLTVPNLGSSDAQFSLQEQNYGYSMNANLNADDTPVSLSQINYVPATAGLLPEFPYAGAVPLVGLLGVGAVAYYVRQRQVAKA
nr:hypothetical protein [Bacilli bacterium]